VHARPALGLSLIAQGRLTLQSFAKYINGHRRRELSGTRVGCYLLGWPQCTWELQLQWRAVCHSSCDSCALPCGSTNLKMRSETTLKIYTASSTCPVLGVSAIPGFCFTLGGAIAIPIEPPSTEAAAGVIPSQRSRARDEIYKDFSFSEARPA
jgi:hypothetical protein